MGTLNTNKINKTHNLSSNALGVVTWEEGAMYLAFHASSKLQFHSPSLPPPPVSISLCRIYKTIPGGCRDCHFHL